MVVVLFGMELEGLGFLKSVCVCVCCEFSEFRGRMRLVELGVVVLGGEVF